MPKSDSLIKLYSEISSCSKRCASINNDAPNGIIGRSYYCPFDPENVKLLMVSKNPGIGNPLEAKLYKPLSPTERVFAHEKVQTDRFKGGSSLIKSKYHANILDWVSIILGVAPTHDAVFAESAMTAIVKCQSISDKTAKLSPSTIAACTNHFLFRELEEIKPKFLLALGGEAYDFLTNPQIRRFHKLPVEVLYHPSWTNMKGGVENYKRGKLVEIRKSYHEAIRI